jgi:hypothetical protein
MRIVARTAFVLTSRGTSQTKICAITIDGAKYKSVSRKRAAVVIESNNTEDYEIHSGGDGQDEDEGTSRAGGGDPAGVTDNNYDDGSFHYDPGAEQLVSI